MLKKILIGCGWVVGFVVVAAGGVMGWASWNISGRFKKSYDIPPVTFRVDVAKADLALGERIAKVRNACVECHGQDLAGGVVIESGALAHIYGSNITPAALKDWTDGEIARAIRHGVSKDGRPLRLMPSNEFVNLSESDLAAVVAYVRSVPAVEKPSRPITFGPVGRILLATGQLPTMLPAEIIPHEAAFLEKPEEAPTAAFGKYLVNSACISCHREDLSGGPVPGGDPNWPPAANLTPALIGSWKEADFINTLKTGINPDRATLRDPMSKIVKYTAQMTDTELKAIWAYVRSVKAVEPQGTW